MQAALCTGVFLMLTMVPASLVWGLGQTDGPIPGPVGLAFFGLAGLLWVGQIVATTTLWPYLYLMVDEPSEGLAPLWQAAEVTKGSRLSIFALFLIEGLLNAAAGCFTCGLGFLFTGPLSAAWNVVAYEQLMGRRPVLRDPCEEEYEDEGYREDGRPTSDDLDR